jgi:hypothetical protein
VWGSTHKGRHFKEIWEDERQYCLWCASHFVEEKMTTDQKAFIVYLSLKAAEEE